MQTINSEQDIHGMPGNSLAAFDDEAAQRASDKCVVWGSKLFYRKPSDERIPPYIIYEGEKYINSADDYIRKLENRPDGNSSETVIQTYVRYRKASTIQLARDIAQRNNSKLHEDIIARGHVIEQPKEKPSEEEAEARRAKLLASRARSIKRLRDKGYGSLIDESFAASEEKYRTMPQYNAYSQERKDSLKYKLAIELVYKAINDKIWG